MSTSEEKYRQKYSVISQKWSQPFVEYFDHQIDPEVTSAAGRWILEPLGTYNGYSGVTTNQSEGFNILLKNLTERKESCIDSLVLSLYYLQCYYNNEIQRGWLGWGNTNYSALSSPWRLNYAIWTCSTVMLQRKLQRDCWRRDLLKLRGKWYPVKITQIHMQ